MKADKHSINKIKQAAESKDYKDFDEWYRLTYGKDRLLEDKGRQ